MTMTATGVFAMPTNIFHQKYNIFLVYSPDLDADMILATKKMATDYKKYFASRNIAVIAIYPMKIEMLHAPDGISLPSSQSLANNLRYCYVVKKTDFRVIFIGKDGEEKIRAAHLPDMAEIAGAIASPSTRQWNYKKQASILQSQQVDD